MRSDTNSFLAFKSWLILVIESFYSSDYSIFYFEFLMVDYVEWLSGNIYSFKWPLLFLLKSIELSQDEFISLTLILLKFGVITDKFVIETV